PRKAIRQQQATVLKQATNLRVEICEDEQVVHNCVVHNDIIVLTPQKLVNSLKNGHMKLSDIDMMIFDECHNTSGGNPYCEIMKYYLCPSLQNFENSTKPIVIGLTATIGSKDSSEKKHPVLDNLVSICSKLACCTISIVQNLENIQEVDSLIPRPSNDSFEFVRKTQYNRYFYDYIKLMKDLLTVIADILEHNECLASHEMGTSSYIQQLVILEEYAQKLGQVSSVSICEYLICLSKKFLAFYDLPFDMVLNEINKQIDIYYKRNKNPYPVETLVYNYCKETLNKILTEYSSNPAANSKLNDLITLLEGHANGKAKGNNRKNDAL
ncbi:unnamed protein product, partial [Didymodactylos carnosus]